MIIQPIAPNMRSTIERHSGIRHKINMGRVVRSACRRRTCIRNVIFWNTFLLTLKGFFFSGCLEFVKWLFGCFNIWFSGGGSLVNVRALYFWLWFCGRLGEGRFKWDGRFVRVIWWIIIKSFKSFGGCVEFPGTTPMLIQSFGTFVNCSTFIKYEKGIYYIWKGRKTFFQNIKCLKNL